MFKLHFLTIFLMAQATLAYADNDPVYTQDDVLPSPYFIDGVHCIGTNQKEVSESWLVSKEEVEITQQIESQEDCEELIKAFGIEKHKWLDMAAPITLLISTLIIIGHLEFLLRSASMQTQRAAFLKRVQE
jgi:hypothetical protein